MSKSIFARTAFSALVAALASACVTSPFDNSAVDNVGSNIPFNGFVEAPGATIVIEALDYTTGRWIELGRTTSLRVADAPAGFWRNSKPLYRFSKTVQITQPNIWRASDWGRRFDATLRARQVGGLGLVSFNDQAQVDCMLRNRNMTQADAYAACRGDGETVIRIHTFG